jgi:hypothetical protein
MTGQSDLLVMAGSPTDIDKPWETKLLPDRIAAYITPFE